jgi:hypothetical protein
MKAKRRDLGFEIIWKPEKRENVLLESHHIDVQRVVFIPKDLHRSIPHNVRTGKGMEEINILAFQYIITGGI